MKGIITAATVAAQLFWSVCSRNNGEANLEGVWQGTVKQPHVELRIVFEIAMMPNGALQAKMLMPDQNKNEFPVTVVVFKDSQVHLDAASIQGSFEGRFYTGKGIIEGRWKQGHESQPLVLVRVSDPIRQVKSLMPIPPYPYLQRSISFVSSEPSVELAGTLTWPKKEGLCPAVILIPGVGAHDRDYTIMGHRPFLVLSDYLTRRGIGVLRYDERGVGESTGDRTHATSENYARDVLAAMDYLKACQEIDPKQIGLVGHSEGGTIASLAAVRSRDVAFIVMMGSPGLSGVDYNYQFEESMGRILGLSEEAIAEKRAFQKKVFDILLFEKDQRVAQEKLFELYEKLDPDIPKHRIQAAVKRFLSPWFYFNLTYDPRTTLSQVRCPVLAIFGGKDMQVPPAGNARAIKKALELGGNRNHEVTVLSGLNHFFQTAESGAPAEYGQIEGTISVSVLELVANWIVEQTRNPMSSKDLLP